MPRDGSGVYSYPSGGAAVSGAAIGSTAYNTRAADVLSDLNAARPISAGGTGATTAGAALTALGAQASDATLAALAALSIASGKVIYGTGTDTFALADSVTYGRSLWNVADEAALKALINAEAGTDFQAYDADTLKSDVAATLSAGYLSDSYSGGTVSSGTYTPAPQTGQENFQHYTNGGAHTLAPPASVCAVVVEILNNGSAGAITTSGFTKVTGDSFTTTNGHKFLAHITKSNSYSHLHVTALQ